VTGFVGRELLLALPVTLGAVALLMLLTLGVAKRVGRYAGIDVTWGLGFAVVAVVAWALSVGEGSSGADVRRSVVALLTVVWGVRLATHIFLRNRKHEGEDPRYTALLAKAEGRGIDPTWFVVSRVYLTQGAAMWFVSLPVQVAVFGRGGLDGLAYAGVVVWGIGIFFEAVGDWQLTRFKADPASEGQVLDTGLWRYTRHPNYFGDACVWWGLSLLAFAQWPGILTLPSVVLMTWLLAKGTGAKLLESTIGDRRAGYARYVQNTSGFIPLPPAVMSRWSARRREH
jgi:steroid 5-alpha reductase family enzyme